MKKLIFASMFMFSMVFISCKGSAHTETAATDSIAADTVVVDTIATDTVANL